MLQIQAIFKFLGTLWGLLASVAILFPGAAALLKVPIATSESTIAPLYPVIATTLSAFCVLLLITLRSQLADLRFARNLGTFGVAAAVTLFFAFVLVRIVYLDVDEYRVVSTDKVKNLEVREYRRRGLLGELHLEIVGTSTNGGQKIIYESKKGDPLDVVAMLLFTCTFASLTVAFTALGIHTYEANSSRPKRPSSPD